MRRILQYHAVVLRLKNDTNQRDDVWMSKMDVDCHLTFQLMRHPAPCCSWAVVNHVYWQRLKKSVKVTIKTMSSLISLTITTIAKVHYKTQGTPSNLGHINRPLVPVMDLHLTYCNPEMNVIVMGHYSNESLVWSVTSLKLNPNPEGTSLISYPTEGRRLGWHGWLVTHQNGIPANGHLSRN